MVAGEGFEPSTFRLWAWWDTTSLPCGIIMCVSLQKETTPSSNGMNYALLRVTILYTLPCRSSSWRVDFLRRTRQIPRATRSIYFYLRLICNQTSTLWDSLIPTPSSRLLSLFLWWFVKTNTVDVQFHFTTRWAVLHSELVRLDTEYINSIPTWYCARQGYGSLPFF